MQFIFYSFQFDTFLIFSFHLFLCHLVCAGKASFIEEYIIKYNLNLHKLLRQMRNEMTWNQGMPVWYSIDGNLLSW